MLWSPKLLPVRSLRSRCCPIQSQNLGLWLCFWSWRCSSDVISSRLQLSTYTLRIQPRALSTVAKYTVLNIWSFLFPPLTCANRRLVQTLSCSSKTSLMNARVGESLDQWAVLRLISLYFPKHSVNSVDYFLKFHISLVFYTFLVDKRGRTHLCVDCSLCWPWAACDDDVIALGCRSSWADPLWNCCWTAWNQRGKGAMLYL